ncbi:hypothetical protein [Marinomonas profundimaris]|uniref:Uncharacterized protein n=1 Tax=Marinomonas profundimaris TaxID=1208321 RepID=W1RXK2_9GAMM|nr:hypothetical protein [Marinomonas profundimaris]ETI60414.1 hypothetical protein D104_09290 [Marinomonas profundimaris]
MIFEDSWNLFFQNTAMYVSNFIGKGAYDSLIASIIVFSISCFFSIVFFFVKIILQKRKASLICGFWVGINPSFDKARENISIDLLYISPRSNEVKIKHWYYHYTGDTYRYNGKGVFENNELVSYYRGIGDYSNEVGVTIYRFIKGRLSGSMIQYSSQVSDDVRLIFEENNSNLYKVKVPVLFRVNKLFFNKYFSNFNKAFDFISKEKNYFHIKTIEFSKESIPALTINKNDIGRERNS